jgi:hypothetical protein
MEYKFFGGLYRNGTETASNTQYMWCVDWVPTSNQKRAARLTFVKRYNGLSIQQIDTICNEVDRYQGPQKNLIRKINKILNTN